MKTPKKILYVLSWIIPLLAKLGFAILGLVAVPIALKAYGSNSGNWPKFFWIWANREHPVPPGWHGDSFWTDFTWFAIRNPVNNSRFIFDEPPADKLLAYGWPSDQMEATDLIRLQATKAQRWVTYKWMAGYRRVWLGKEGKYSEIWFGWKLGSPVPGLGFTVQIRINRDIGT